MKKNQKERHGKSIARENAIKSLYTFALTNEEIGIYSKDNLANAMTKNTIVHLSEIDQEISARLRKWSITELNQVNLAILRLATYEILFEDTPKNIVVNEALELSKIYSDEKSKKFIHGVLDKIIKG